MSKIIPTVSLGLLALGLTLSILPNGANAQQIRPGVGANVSTFPAGLGTAASADQPVHSLPGRDPRQMRISGRQVVIGAAWPQPLIRMPIVMPDADPSPATR